MRLDREGTEVRFNDTYKIINGIHQVKTYLMFDFDQVADEAILRNYHSLNGSSDSVNGDLQFLWEYANFNHLQNQYP